MSVVKIRNAADDGWIVLGSTDDPDAIHADISGEIAAVTEKASPVDADLLLIEDSAASNVKKRVQIGNLPDPSSALVTAMKGYFKRSKFTYKDANEIYIGAGSYHHDGTTEQVVYWTSQLTKTVSATGADWDYLYIDDSAIVSAGTNLLTASELIFSTTEPAWSESKGGWYNGADRCIGAFYCTGSATLAEFFHQGDYIVWADSYAVYNANIDTTWVDITFRLPLISRSPQAVVIRPGINETLTDRVWYWRTNGQSGSTGHTMYWTQTSASNYLHTNEYASRMITDSTSKIEIKSSVANSQLTKVFQEGYYFGEGV
jgi:hypothetical protein